MVSLLPGAPPTTPITPKTPKAVKKLRASILQKFNSPVSAGSPGATGKKTVSPFWNCSYDLEGSSSFVKSDTKTSIKKKNAKAIRDYKERNMKDKKAPDRLPSRGLSIMAKPPMLVDIVVDDNRESVRSSLTRSLNDSTNLDIRHGETDESDMMIIFKALKKNAFFNQIESEDLVDFVDSFEHILVSAGIDIFKQGEPGDFFYIVGKDSVVEFEANGEKIGQAEDGESFGELSLIYTCPRAATATARSSPTDLYRVDRKTFKTILKKKTRSKAKQKIKLLKDVDFLKDMSEFDLTTLGRAMTPVKFKPDKVVVKKGVEGTAFYIIQEGEMKITDISVGGTKFDDKIIGPGDYFGERSLITNDLTAANVIATTKGFAFRIDRKTFERVLGEFRRVIMKAQDRRIMEGIPVFESPKLTKHQFEELASLVVDKTFKANEEIFSTKKSTTAALYLVREGSVKLSDGRSGIIKPGAYFGEDLLLLDARIGDESAQGNPTVTDTSYTAIATEDCTCGVLSLSDCRTVFETTEMICKEQPNKLEVFAEELSPNSDRKTLLGERKGSERSSWPVSRKPTKPRRNSSTAWLKKQSKSGLRNAVRENIKLEDLKKLEVLGTGQFGEVFLVSTFVSVEYGRKLFALKTQKKNDSVRGDSVAAIKREIELLAKLDHPYIVNLVHYYENPEEMHILMGAVYGGELFDVIHTENDDGTWNSGLPESDAKFYAMVITDTLDYIHRKQFIYRDLKPENVLIDEDGYPIICDFGFAKFVEDKTFTLCGTPNYLSPEIIMNIGHNSSTDHWALGILIYEMVAGENPFYYEGISQMELFRSICSEKFYPLPASVSNDAYAVVDGLLEKDPTLRLGAGSSRGKEIMEQGWFKELKLDDLRQKKHKAPFLPNNETMDNFKVEALTSSEISVPSKVGNSRRESGFRSSIFSD